MTRAEERALEAYPYEVGIKGLICKNSRPIFIQGYEQAEKDLGWHSVNDYLPEVDEEVIVLTDDLGTAPIYKIAFGHIVNKEKCEDYNGWNISGVKFWMPCPTIPKEEEHEGSY